jgi:hypothetical protein
MDDEKPTELIAPGDPRVARLMSRSSTGVVSRSAQRRQRIPAQSLRSFLISVLRAARSRCGVVGSEGGRRQTRARWMEI